MVDSVLHDRCLARWLLGCLAFVSAPARAEEGAAGLVEIRVMHDTSPVRGAVIDAASAHATTGMRGEAELRLAAGRQEIRIHRAGFVAASVAIDVAADANSPIVVQLAPESLESAAVVVTATRSGTVVGDQPIRVEAVPEEEIEENLTAQPGNLSTLLTELAGVRMEPAAAGLNGAGLQIRGFPGRLTQVLSDGLPLIGSEPAGFGLLQTPPLDLKRVEVIKGVASALYGGSALGGVLNLVSRPPEGEPELLLSRSSRDGTDVVGFAGTSLSPDLGFTLTGGASLQEREDLDADAWADLARYRRFTLRPRLFFDNGSGGSLFITTGVVDEQRAGGSLPGRTLADGSTFVEALDTTRFDLGAVGRTPLDAGRMLSGRISATRANHDRQYGDQRVQDVQTSLFSETTLSGHDRGVSWVLGAAFSRDRLDVRDVPGVGHDYTVPGVFAQAEYSPAETVTLAASGRVDLHSDYGTFFSPRLSALFLPSDRWSLRASIGTGFAAPNPFVDQIESTGLGVLEPLSGLQAERAGSASLDAQWTAAGWEANFSVFGSETRHPLEVRAAPEAGRLELVNADGPRRSLGGEALLRYVAGPLQLIGSYTWLDVTEAAPGGGRRTADRIPRQAAELAALLEDETRGRIGIEVSYTGRQALEDNPYRDSGPSYVEINALAELKIGETAIFLNAINLTDVRQADYDPLLRPVPAPDGRRVTDLWAPQVGRLFNLGVRLEF